MNILLKTITKFNCFLKSLAQRNIISKNEASVLDVMFYKSYWALKCVHFIGQLNL